MKKSLMFFLFFLCLTYGLRFSTYDCFAQEDKTVTSLTKQIIEAKEGAEFYAPLEELKGIYFKDNKYSEFADLLKSLNEKKEPAAAVISYYLAFTRYTQLKYLEEKQLWDEYFSKGNDYREELTAQAQKAAVTLKPDDALRVYSYLVLWEFHKGQQDTFFEKALEELVASVSEYAKKGSEAKVIREAADRVFAMGEKMAARKLYKAYAQKVISSEIKDEELAANAAAFFKEGNLELAESLYDVYIERIFKGQDKAQDKENLFNILKALIKDFSYQPGALNQGGLKDPVYAERLFDKLEQAGGREVFNEELMYLRALNLEKSKEYARANEAYSALLKRYPQTAYSDEANFKIAAIYVYALRDLKNARAVFEGLTKREGLSPQGLSAYYHLGLLSQWENDLAKAKDYYDKLIVKAGGDFAQISAMAKERLREINESGQMEYNLRTWLDLSLKEENKEYEISKLDLTSQPAILQKGASLNISSSIFTAASGCMEIQLEFLWCGELGSQAPSSSKPAFDTSYSDKGTKIIGLVVASPSGIVGRGMDIVDVK